MPHPPLPSAYQEFYLGIAEAVRGHAPVPVEARDAVATLTVLEAARLSARNRQVVTV